MSLYYFALVFVAACVGLFFGAAAAFAVLACGFLALNIYHQRNLAKLSNWTHAPIGTPPPEAIGIWDFAFADLSRRARVSSSQKEQLASSLEHFREASQAMPDGVVFLGEADCIEWINQTAEQHFGLNGQRDLGQPITNLVRQPDFVSYIEQRHFEEALVLHSSRNEGVTLAVHIIPFGHASHMVLSRDISRSERLATMRRDFVANVSHELKTPLTVINGFLETIFDGLEDIPPADIKRYLNFALEQSARMQRLVDDLLTLSGLETGLPQPQDERIDAHALANAVAEEAQLLSNGQHEISCKLGSKAFILGSYKELHSAFANLASNAVRYTPAGGKIELCWEISGKNEGRFCVKDQGIGIAEEHIPRLTERFYRVDRGRSRETGGTGLGLAIVKHVLTRHQAALEIDSQIGQGSQFCVKFPAKRIQVV